MDLLAGGQMIFTLVSIHHVETEVKKKVVQICGRDAAMPPRVVGGRAKRTGA